MSKMLKNLSIFICYTNSHLSFSFSLNEMWNFLFFCSSGYSKMYLCRHRNSSFHLKY